MRKTMTPSEIAEWLTVGGEWATAARDHEGAEKHYESATTIRAQAEALKIATEALEEVKYYRLPSVSAASVFTGGADCRRIAEQALARIKEVG